MTAAKNTQPLVHVSVADRACRASILDALRRGGWQSVVQPTGFHVLDAIADVIEERASTMPALLVIDAISRGVAGATIARGLRELGVRIPLVLVARHGDPVPELDDPAVRIAGPSYAAAAVAEIARTVKTGIASTADSQAQSSAHG